MQRQQRLNNDFERRIKYTGILMTQLPSGTRDELSEHQEGILDELEELSQEMEVYVDREGLTRMN